MSSLLCPAGHMLSYHIHKVNHPQTEVTSDMHRKQPLLPKITGLGAVQLVQRVSRL